MNRRFLSVLLTMTMVLMLVPMASVSVSAWAGTACYIDANGNGSFDESTETKYDLVQTAVTAAGTTPSAIVMLEDSTENITIGSNQNITLDLNGYVLKGGANNKNVIYIGEDGSNYGKLTVKDSNTDNQTHKFKVAASGLWELYTGSDAATFTFDSTSGLKKDGVVVTDIPAENSIIAVSGGCITGGNNVDTGGGGIENFGTFNFEGGNIVGNAADNNGGGIWSQYEAYVSGGSIIGNTAGNGGGIWSRADLTVSRGNILYNTAVDNGGGICNDSGIINFSSGKISGNHAGISGGGIYNAGNYDLNSKFSLSGGVISVNTAGASGGGIYNESSYNCCDPADPYNGQTENYKNILCGSIIIGGNPVVENNTLTDTTVSNLYIYENAPDNSSYPKTKNHSVEIGTGGNGVTDPADGMSIGVTLGMGNGSGQFTENGAATDVQYFTSDNDAYGVLFNTDHLELATRLVVTGTTVSGKTYDGTTSVNATVGNTVSGIADGDDVTVSVESAVMEDKNAGAGKTVTVKYTLSGNDAGKYVAPKDDTFTVTVSPKALTIKNVEIADKIYDGTKAATVSNPELDGLVAGDTLEVGTDYTVSAEFDSADASGTNAAESVTVTVTLKDTATAKNYSLSEPTKTIYKTISKADQEVAAPTLLNRTSNRVTLNAQSGQGDPQYGISTTDAAPSVWQDSTEFTGLNEHTQYYFFTKFLGNENYNPAVSSGTAISTDKNYLAAGTEYTISDDGTTTTKIQVIGYTGVQASGLESIATAVKADGNTGNNVKIILTAEKTTETQENKAQVTEIKKTAGNGKTVDLLAIDLAKYINNADSGKITDTGSNVIEVLIPFDAVDKTDINIYRYHNGSVTTFEEKSAAEAGADGTFYYDAANKIIHIFTTKFSTYAIGYTKPTTPVYSGDDSTPVKKAEPKKNPFTDVAETAYYYDAVLWAAENGITSGKTDTTFAPTEVTNRAQMVTFLWRLAGKPQATSDYNPFTDVKEGSYYYDAVLWGVENGVVKGTTKTTFSPYQDVTRGQSMAFIARYAGVTDEATGYTHSFTDVRKNAYYNNAIAWASANGITSGKTATTFAPDEGCQRAHIVVFLYNYFNK